MDDVSEDKVWFVDDPAKWGRGEIISRMRLPDNAIRLPQELNGSMVVGAEDRMYEVWTPEKG